MSLVPKIIPSWSGTSIRGMSGDSSLKLQLRIWPHSIHQPPLLRLRLNQPRLSCSTISGTMTNPRSLPSISHRTRKNILHPREEGLGLAWSSPTMGNICLLVQITTVISFWTHSTEACEPSWQARKAPLEGQLLYRQPESLLVKGMYASRLMGDISSVARETNQMCSCGIYNNLRTRTSFCSPLADYLTGAAPL